MNGKILHERETSIEGGQGYTVEVKTRDRGDLLCLREFKIGKRVYNLQVFGSPAGLDNPDVVKFFNSFKPLK